MLFKNREEGGKLLAEKLSKYKGAKDCIVIGLPRGGVVTAHELAKKLELPLDVVCPRKIGAPMNPEYAVGAITETGEGIFDEHALNLLKVSKEYLNKEVQEQKEIAQRRLKAFRGHRPPRQLKGKKVILVDDGIATGATVKAAIRTIRSEGAQSIILAIPVAAPDSYNQIKKMVDDSYVLSLPREFQAVGQFYLEFGQTSDEEVVDIMKTYE